MSNSFATGLGRETHELGNLQKLKFCNPRRNCSSALRAEEIVTSNSDWIYSACRNQLCEAEAASFFFRSLCRRGCVQFDLHLAHFGSRTILELVGVDDDVQRADLCQPELLVLDACSSRR